MIEFKEWRRIYLENSDREISGPGIRALLAEVRRMLDLTWDNSVERNDIGFNQTDNQTIRIYAGYVNRESIPASIASLFLNILRRYKNTQVKGYDQIEAAVHADFGIEKTENVIVYDKRPVSYGKYKIFVPGGIDMGMKRKVNVVLNQYFEEKNIPKEYTKFGLAYPTYKVFSNDTEPNAYLVHPNVLQKILDLLRDVYKKEITFESGATSFNVASAQDASGDASNSLMSIKGLVKTNWGPRISVNLEKSLYFKLKNAGLTPKGVAWDQNSQSVMIDFKSDLYNDVKKVLLSGGISQDDIKKLDDIANSPEAKESESDKKDTSKSISFFDDTENKIKIKVSYFDFARDEEKKLFLKEAIQYTFPEYTFANYTYTVSGMYRQYATFARILKRFGYDTSELESIMKNKVSRGDLIETKYEGHLDHDEEFKKSIDNKLPNMKYDLYDAQKDGIAYLHSRHSMVLGDETGLGKCQHGSSLIQTNKGLFTMEELWNKFSKNPIANPEGEEWADCENLYVHAMNSDEKIVKSKVVGLYRQKINSKLKEIKTSNGKKTISTIPHKFYTINGWKSDITEKDYICSSSNQFSLEANDFNDLELTKLLAWQIGEGYEILKSKKIKITQKDPSVLYEIKNIYDNMKFKNLIKKQDSKSLIKKTKKGCYELIINSSKYCEHIINMGYSFGKKSSEKEIPEFIMGANDEIVKEFIKNYFDAEAHVYTKFRRIEVSSASKKLIYQLSLLLQRFNILCTHAEKTKMATNGKRIKRKYYCLYVCGSGVDSYFEKIGLDTDYKQRSYYEINTKHNSNKDGKPMFNVLAPFFEKHKIPCRLLDILDKEYIKGGKFACKETIEKAINGFEKLKNGYVLANYFKSKKSKWTKSTLEKLLLVTKEECEEVIEKLKKLKDNDLQYEKVKSVKTFEFDGYVYDLCVEDHKNYICENVICHNTVQLVAAAELKMQETRKPTLIITLKSVQNQWIQTILDVVGDDKSSLISTDGLNPKQWTVLYYENFSAGKNKDAIVQKLSETDFGIVIFDELHKLKHKKTLRMENIAKVIEKIPVRWGATATISSNKPMDVRQQLDIIGHHLGKIKESKFKRDFVGTEDKKDPEAVEKQIEAAEKLNKWLNISGVYKRRAKSDIREMPNISVKDRTVSVDENEFQKLYNAKKSKYKDEDLEISKLIAARESVARLKVDDTVFRAMKIVSGNLDGPPAASKIVVFTNFIEPGKMLVDHLNEHLKDIDEKFYVLDYLSSTKKSDRIKVKERFTNDPNAKILVMSMRMGGTGIDFPNAAQNMLINDFDWTPESAEQSEGRIYRINTNHPVNIQYIVAGGIDKALYDIVQRKRKLAATIQRYREEYHDKPTDKEVLTRLIQAQKDMGDLDKEMHDVQVKFLPDTKEMKADEAFVYRMKSRLRRDSI